ncbi:hypothetical protein J7E95_30635 [Streptomyces sp. ISL-14]|nr:hypothetical protein [Streptomyces sp. ISL-14]
MFSPQGAGRRRIAGPGRGRGARRRATGVASAHSLGGQAPLCGTAACAWSPKRDLCTRARCGRCGAWPTSVRFLARMPLVMASLRRLQAVGGRGARQTTDGGSGGYRGGGMGAGGCAPVRVQPMADALAARKRLVPAPSGWTGVRDPVSTVAIGAIGQCAVNMHGKNPPVDVHVAKSRRYCTPKIYQQECIWQRLACFEWCPTGLSGALWPEMFEGLRAKAFPVRK